MDQTHTLPQTQWSLSSRIFFRFFFVYFALYIFPFPLNLVEFYDFSLIWDAPVLWLGETLFGYEITVRPNGSGDTTWNYVQVLLFAIIAVIATVVWSVVDRHRASYDTLYLWLIIALRFYLGSVMITYGFAKVIKTQFPAPFLGRLAGTYGDSSPMGLLWTFMGFSKAYNFFTGMAEVMGGFLLFFRKTRLLAALICIGVMSNVVMLNFTYDVPVKLYSSHLLAMAFFLVIPDVKRLVDFFIMNKSVESSVFPMPFQNKRLIYASWGIKTLLIGYTMVFMPIMSLQMLDRWGDSAPKPPFYGIYDVKVHARNGDTLPPLIGHNVRWRQMVVEFKDWATVDYMDASKAYWRFAADTAGHQIEIYSSDSVSHYKFNYAETNPDEFELIGGDSTNNIYFRLKRKLPQDYLLMNRGFNWVNEYPFNR